MKRSPSPAHHSRQTWTERIVAALDAQHPNLTEARNGLVSLHRWLSDAGEECGSAAVTSLDRVLAMAEQETADGDIGDGVASLLGQCAELLKAFGTLGSIAAWGDRVIEEIRERWGDSLDAFEGDSNSRHCNETWEFDCDWTGHSQGADDSGGDPADSLVIPDFRDLLAALSDMEESGPSARTTAAAVPADSFPVKSKTVSFSSREDDSVDHDLLPAFLDDGIACLESMEAALEEVLAQHAPEDALRHYGRQLHTLKGAAGAVGLRRFSTYLHHLEDQIEEVASGGQPVQGHLMAAGIDAVRSLLAELGGPDLSQGLDPIPPPVSKIKEEPHRHTPTDSAGIRSAGRPDTDAFVRIETTRVDHLLDLLSELVMLRSRRETSLQQIRRLREELDRCIEKTRSLCPGSGRKASGGTSAGAVRPGGPSEKTTDFQYSAVSEVANDLAEVSRTLRTILEPMEEDNSAVSLLIGRFRRELMDLRRLPMTGLFHRIEKAAVDAARTEGKRIEVEFRGHGTRAERMLQERLFEPLMHLVRNAVGHGIETPVDRRAHGKPETGRIVLEADSTPTALLIEVRDDGRGLDDRAIERKGRELGLIPPGDKLKSRELWNLIFHSGFSTRDEVNEVAGRGIGMDVVATRIRQLRGRVTVDSTPRAGTVFRILIPLRSPIEHAMIVRSGGQCFALPMHAVFGLGNEQSGADERNAVCLSDLLGLPDQAIRDRKILTLSQQAAGGSLPQPSFREESVSRDRRLSIAVDGVLGVQEVVVRSLPRMLSGHELFSGVTLGADAEIVLIFDVPRLIEYGLQRRPARVTHTGLKPSSIPSFEASADLTGRDAHGDAAVDRAPIPAEHIAYSMATEPAVSPSVPADTPKESRDQFADPSDDPPDRGRRPILVVDDSLSVRRHIVRKLQALGFSTAEAGDGQEALEILRTRPFAAMITDIDMPRINGTSLLAEIRQRAAWRRMPIYVVSSRTEKLLQEQLFKLGARQVFVKPITDSNVGDIVTQVIAFSEIPHTSPREERT